MKTSQTLLLGLLVLGSTAAPVAAKDYKIKLHRPAKVGERYRMTEIQTKREAMTILKGGNVLMQRDKTEKSTLQGVVEVQKVDKEGEVLKLQLTVEKFVNGKSVELLKKGQIVIAQTIENKTAYRLKDGTLTDDVKKRLGSLLKTKTETSESDDKVFGTKDRQNVGDSWKVDSAFAGKSLKISPKNVNGKVKLVAVEQFEGREVLRISGNMKLNDLPGLDQLAKQGFEKKSLKCSMQMVSLYPTDHRIQPPKNQMSMSVDAEFLGVKGPIKGLTMKMVVRQTSAGRRTDLK